MSTYTFLCVAQHAPIPRVTSFSFAAFDDAGVLTDGLFAVAVNPEGATEALAYRLTVCEGDDTHDELLDQAACFAVLGRFLLRSPIITHDYDLVKDVLQRVPGFPITASAAILDCAWLSHIALPHVSDRSLSTLSGVLQCDLAPIDMGLWQEAYTLYTIFKSLCYRLQRLPTLTLQTIGAGAPVESPLQHLVNNWIVQKLATQIDTEQDWKMIDGLAFHPAARNASDDTGESDQPALQDAAELASESVHLLHTTVTAAASFALEQRRGQAHMIEAVSQALVVGGQLIVEAGTGTGKSLAYLLPAALYAARTAKRVVISTHTIALQEQLRQKDLTLLAESAPNMVRTAILKGRTHYLCMRKLSVLARAASSLVEAQRDAALAITVWLTQTQSGDREELALAPHEQGFWAEVQSESESCIHKRCPFFRDCFYFRARATASSADIVVTNHSLVLSDLAADHNLLPAYEHLIIDEAHHLEDQATRQFGAQVSEETFVRALERLGASRGLLPELGRLLHREIDAGHPELQPYVAWTDQLLRVLTETTRATRDMPHMISAWVMSSAQSGERRVKKETINQGSYASVHAFATRLLDLLRLHGKSLADLEGLLTDIELDDALYGRTEDVAGLVRELRAALTVVADVLLVRNSEDTFVGWIAWRQTRTGVRFSHHLAPLSVASILRDQLFASKTTVICTSATLSVSGDFTYFAERIGLAGASFASSRRTLLVPSPFQYKKQALLCVATDLPDTKDDNFEQAIGTAIGAIAADANGRTLVLFTSNQMLAGVYRAQRQNLQSLGLRLFAQGMDDHRRSSLIDAFRQEDRAILFGVNSFWEGIDIRGDDLRCLIIVKLPFAVPTHPVAQARAEVLARLGKSPFQDYSLPQAVIRFTQGFGRLIRSEQDRGAVFVLDKRMVTTKYGRLFVSSLPNPAFSAGPLADLRMRARAYF